MADTFGWWDTSALGHRRRAQPDTHSNPANANIDTIRAGEPPETTERFMGWSIEALRPGHLNYLSYESALANAGSLSQQPYWYTLATTGNPGEYATRYGT